MGLRVKKVEGINEEGLSTNERIRRFLCPGTHQHFQGMVKVAIVRSDTSRKEEEIM